MNDTKTAPGNNLAGMDLKLDVNVRLIEPKNNLLAVASVTIGDCFVVKGIKVAAGEKGLFVSMPSAQDGNGNYHDIAHPITGAFRERLNRVVMDGYDNAIERNQSIGNAQRGYAIKTPIADRLEAGKVKAYEQSAGRQTFSAARRTAAELG